MAITGTLYIVSAPSGAGKSSMINAYLSRHRAYPAQVSVSHTTRSVRPGEIDGNHYHFVDHHQFKQLIDEQAFFEYAEVFGNFYGTSRHSIEQTLAEGIDVFLDIDWQGARQVKMMMPEAVSVFILPPSREELENRLHMRGQDSPEVIKKRMNEAESEMSHYDEYDYLIINGNFDEALSELTAIITSQRLQTRQQAAKHQALLNELLSK
ncbi:MULTISPECIES: guanylate kinase [unclassified Agarivorans]|uniref:guanylate kinase n=1 Tax=unclassified Agarivorans TaxID=2636026 RepID=UPI003D7EE65C